MVVVACSISQDANEDSFTQSMAPFMSSTAANDAVDDARLASLGYKPELQRQMTMFTSFAASFSIISILTGVTGLYTQGFIYGGPVAIIWGWVIVTTMTMTIGASLAEICSAFPTAGSVYYFSYALASPNRRALAAWVTGWLNLIGQVAATSGTFYTFATIVTEMILMLHPGGAEMATSPRAMLLYYSSAIVASGLINSCKIKYVAFCDAVSVVWHIVGTVVFAVALLAIAPTHQPASYVFGRFNDGAGTGVPSSPYVFMLGLLMSQYTLGGYDASAKMAEESHNAARVAPLSIILAIAASGVVGWLYLLAITFSIQDPATLLDPSNATKGNFVVGQIVLDACVARGLSRPRTVAVLLLAVPLVASFFCSNSNVTSCSRALFAFARDKAVPGHRLLARVNRNTRSPVTATWVMTFATFLLGLPMLGSTVAFTAVTSLATIGLNLSYAAPIFFRVVNGSSTFIPGPFHLGWMGVPVGLVAVCWVAFVTVLFVLPTAYPVVMVNLNYAGVALSASLLLCISWWLLDARRYFNGPATLERPPCCLSLPDTSKTQST